MDQTTPSKTISKRRKCNTKLPRSVPTRRKKKMNFTENPTETAQNNSHSHFYSVFPNPLPILAGILITLLVSNTNLPSLRAKEIQTLLQFWESRRSSHSPAPSVQMFQLLRGRRRNKICLFQSPLHLPTTEQDSSQLQPIPSCLEHSLLNPHQIVIKPL